MESNKKIILLIPSYNEEEKIIRLLQKLKKDYQTIVIDDGSTDNTFVKIHKLTTYCIRNHKNIGYQKSIEKGMKFAKKKNYDCVVTFDADEQFNVKDIKKFYIYLNLNFDLVIGIRKVVPRISEKIFNFYCKKKFNLDDILCGLKGYNLKSLNVRVFNQNYNACSNIALDYIKRNMRIKKIYVKTYKRKDVSRFGNIYSANLKIIKDLIREIFN